MELQNEVAVEKGDDEIAMILFAKAGRIADGTP